MAGGSLISRVYDFVNGMILNDFHLDDEFNNLVTWINGKLGNANIAPDADIEGTKLKVGSVPMDRIQGSFYTQQQVDTKIADAALSTAPDRSVLGVKLTLGAVGIDEIDTSEVATKSSVDDLRETSLTWFWINL